MPTDAEPWLPNGDLEQLSGTGFTDVRHVAETGSTNADLLAAARDGIDPPIVLLTDHQTAGRGRQDRSWYDKPGDSLLVSVLITAAPTRADLVPLAAGLAAAAAVDTFVAALASPTTSGGPPSPVAGLKWPNDLLIPGLGERKLAGILVESTTTVGSDGDLAVVIGMGLNLCWSSEPPTELVARGVTLADVVQWAVGTTLPDRARPALLIEYLKALDLALTTLTGPQGRSKTIERYRRRCLTVGRSVALVTPTGGLDGRAVGIGGGGELLVDDGTGAVLAVTAGDAHHRSRPASGGASGP